MTENRRIVLNIVATYARSLFGLAAGFFISRWLFQALGPIDFGLFGVLGGLMAFVGLVCRALSIANGRFYAISIGASKAAGNSKESMEECRRWFSVAFFTHTVVAFVFAGVGYLIGVWLLKNWLTIPPERLSACITAFGCTCFASFIGMLTVPYLAMYTAKQEIAESTAFSLLGTVSMLWFGWYMVSHPGDWMVRYAFVSCLLAVLPSILMVIRAIIRYPECKIRLEYMFDWSRARQVLSFSGWAFVATLSVLLRTDGINILINKFFGVSVNAAYSIANQLEGKTEMLNGSLKGAFTPAITQAYGAGEMERMCKLAFGMCKFGVLSSLVFMIPLALEIKEVMRLWLGTPPEFAASLCVISMIYHIGGMSTQGFDTAVGATGRVKRYLLISSGIALLTLPAVAAVVWMGGGVYAMAITLACMIILHSMVRLVVASRITGLSCRTWLRGIVLPVASAAFVSVICGIFPRLLLPSGWERLFATVSFSVIAFILTAWYFALDGEEKMWIRGKVLRRIGLCR